MQSHNARDELMRTTFDEIAMLDRGGRRFPEIKVALNAKASPSTTWLRVDAYGQKNSIPCALTPKRWQYERLGSMARGDRAVQRAVRQRMTNARAAYNRIKAEG